MLRYLLSRSLHSLLLLAGVLVLVFLMVRLVGDPVALMLPKEASAEHRAAFKAGLGLDDPLVLQFWNYLAGVVQGDLGRSLRTQQDNWDMIMERLPATLELAFAALLFSWLVAVPLGILAGMYPFSLLARLAVWLGFAGQVVPSYWLAMLLILLFSVQLGWLPSFGRDSLVSLVLPTVALGFAIMGQLLRLTVAVVDEVRSSDYIRTARGKGLGEFGVAGRHLLPNVLIPLVAVSGVQFTYLLGGSIYIETVFAWPGLGSLLNTAIQDADFPLIQAITLFVAFFAIAVQLLTDVFYSLIDPRVQHG
jgi:ABC-type dipeptide/oligopeptide/nickel transport system permease component